LTGDAPTIDPDGGGGRKEIAINGRRPVGRPAADQIMAIRPGNSPEILESGGYHPPPVIFPEGVSPPAFQTLEGAGTGANSGSTSSAGSRLLVPRALSKVG